jgi:hypothetical protein
MEVEMARLPKTPAYVYMNEQYTATVYDMDSLHFWVKNSKKFIDTDRIRLTKISSSPKLNKAVVEYIENIRNNA